VAIYKSIREAEVVAGDGLVTYKMLDATNGCVNGFCCGIAYFDTTEYPASNPVHDDQEGFVCMQGSGWAKVGDEEFRVEPQCAWIVKAGTAHGLKRDPSCQGPLVVCWFHGAV
jgi:hypothetical protein